MYLNIFTVLKVTINDHQLAPSANRDKPNDDVLLRAETRIQDRTETGTTDQGQSPNLLPDISTKKHLESGHAIVVPPLGPRMDITWRSPVSKNLRISSMLAAHLPMLFCDMLLSQVLVPVIDALMGNLRSPYKLWAFTAVNLMITFSLSSHTVRTLWWYLLVLTFI